MPMVLVHGRTGFFTYFAGTGISPVGNVMAGIALPWFVLQTTGSATRTGVVAAMSVLPMFVGGMFGGPLVDRLGARRMAILSDVVSGLAVLGIPVLYVNDALSWSMLLAFVFLGALLDVPGVTARRLLLPKFAETGRFRPDTTYSWFEMLVGISGVAGPSLAGIVIGLTGPVTLLWINGASFLISALGVSLTAPAHGERCIPTRDPYVEELRQGVAFLCRDPLLLSMALTFGATNVVSWAFSGVGLPVRFFRETGSAAHFGWMVTCIGLGAVTGTAVWGAVGYRLREHRRMIMLGIFMTTIPWMFLMAAFPPLPLLLAIGFLYGLTGGPLNPISVAVRMERIPEQLRGRVFATFSAFTAILSPIGPAIMGPAVERWGIDRAMWGCAVAYVIAVASTPFLRSWRDLDRPITDGADADRL